MEVGQKVIVYTMIMRGSAQTSYVGTVLAMNGDGLSLDSAAGKMFFPWSAIERVSY